MSATGPGLQGSLKTGKPQLGQIPTHLQTRRWHVLEIPQNGIVYIKNAVSILFGTILFKILCMHLCIFTCNSKIDMNEYACSPALSFSNQPTILASLDPPSQNRSNYNPRKTLKKDLFIKPPFCDESSIQNMVNGPLNGQKKNMLEPTLKGAGYKSLKQIQQFQPDFTFTCNFFLKRNTSWKCKLL